MMFWEEDQEKKCEECKKEQLEELQQQITDYEFEIALQKQLDFIRTKNMPISGRTTG